jgi:hypothetical protein
MDFPITDLMSEKASEEWIMEYLHPLVCGAHTAAQPGQKPLSFADPQES